MSRQQHFFHGTSTARGITNAVLPPAKTGAQRYNIEKRHAGTRPEEYNSRDNASVTERSRVAWAFAHMTAEETGGRAVVYTTGRAPDQRLGLEHHRNEHFRGGWRTHEHISREGFPVTGREDVPPPEKWERETGRQGTLPLDFTGLQQRVPWAPEKLYTMHPLPANHPDMASQRRETRRIAQQEKRRTHDEAVAGQFGRAKQRSRQQLLPGMRGTGK